MNFAFCPYCIFKNDPQQAHDPVGANEWLLLGILEEGKDISSGFNAEEVYYLLLTSINNVVVHILRGDYILGPYQSWL